jgi:predicted phosphodiesterase
VFYRVVAQSLQYANAYNIFRGPPVETEVRRLQLPHAEQETTTIAIVNDTHENESTVTALAKRVHELAPDLLIWNGDACNHFSKPDRPAALLLRPGANGESASAGGWAATRALLFVCGNHDIRGSEARQLSAILAPGPHPQLPWNTARRIGPLALIALDTGEDKPDHHPVFAGTAAYEPYRERQATWLATQLARPEITQAPFKVAITHIPLRGLPGQNDGTTLEGAAAFSGQGAGLWLPQLIRAGFQAILSGHTHEWRVDPPTTAEPITQFVGGGPKPDKATIMVMEVHPDRLTTRMEHLKGDVLATETWSR